MSEQVYDSFNRLKQYCERERFIGWDPYDGLNSGFFQSLPYISKNRIVKLGWIQAFKRSPLNLRPLFGIRKEPNPKGLALFLSGYSKLSSSNESRKEALPKIEMLAENLIGLKTAGFSGNCWGYNFDW